MLSVKKLNLGQATTYYQKDNYYTKQLGEFHGSLKDELGLDNLTHQDFVELLNGRCKGEFLTASKTKNSVPAFDFTFSANKSLSIAYEIAMREDRKFAQKLVDIHNTATNKALNYIEKNHIQTRTQKKKKKRVEKTGNMLVAKFQHDTSRELDPQLHTHCVIFNFTKDSSSKFKTLDMSNLLKKGSKIVKNLGSYYRYHLKQELLKNGIDIRVTDKKENFFELKNVDEKLIKAFSKRREQIKKEVEKLKDKYPDLNHTELYQIATLNSRIAKKDVDRDKVRDINIKTAEQIINPKELLKNLKQNSSSFKKQKQNIDDKSLVKVIKKVKKEIKNPYHSTTDNIAISTLSKLQNIKVDIDKVFNIVKSLKANEQVIDEIKAEIKELKTMHDVVINQLSSSSFKTLDLKNRLKNVNIDKAKDNLIERIKNGKSKYTQNGDANEAYKRFIKITSSITTRATTDVEKFKRQYQSINRTDVTRRARRFRQRGDESKRDESYSVRNVERDYNYYKISKDELKRDSSMIKSDLIKKMGA